MTSLLIIKLVACGGGETSGTLTNSNELGTLTKAQLQALLPQIPEIAQLPAAQRDALASEVKYDVRLVAFEYTTAGPQGEARRASALGMLPAMPEGPVQTVAYMHGTSTKRSDAPSSGDYDENLDTAILFAARGRLVVAPDYLGLGSSDLEYHPYLHRDTLANAGRDALVAGVDLAQRSAVAVNGDLFVIGYSEGGFAAAALQRLLDRSPLSGLALRTTMSIAGPLDLPAALQTALRTDPATGQRSGRSVYAALTVWTYQLVYGDLFEQPTDLFELPYASDIATLFDGSREANEIAVALPSSPRQLLKPVAVDATLNGTSRLAGRIRENDVLDDNPSSPLISCHGTADDTVPYQVTVTARDRLSASGYALTTVDLVGKTHESAYTPCILEAVRRFR